MFSFSLLPSNDSSTNHTSYDYGYDEDELIWNYNSDSAANLSSSQDPTVFLEEVDEKIVQIPKIRPKIKPDRAAGGKDESFQSFYCNERQKPVDERY